VRQCFARHQDIHELNHGHLPVVVIDKPGQCEIAEQGNLKGKEVNRVHE
jgi:hypothetical protein